MKKIRIIPIFVALTVSTALLFGGWSLFRHQVKEAPLQAAINSLPQVTAADISWQAKQLMITLEVNPDSNLREAVQEAYKKAVEQTKDTSISIQIHNQHSTDSLEAWWSRALFSVAEAMSHHRYGDIPLNLEKQAAELEGMKVITEMDDHFIYLTLKQGAGTKMIVLPLQGEQMGVWPNAEMPEILA